MFGTVVHDVFEQTETAAVHRALEALCSPTTSFGWASVGIYCFFDPAMEAYEVGHSNVLYLGLARDLPERFAQHVGLIKFSRDGCKVDNIEKWFEKHDRLGFSCFVQSPLAQVDTHRERHRFRRAAHDEELPHGIASNPPDGLESAAIVEGQIIETHRLLHGKRPPWNKIGGNKEGAARAAEGTADGLLRLMDGRLDSLFRARLPLRLLAEHETADYLEPGLLHLARMMTIGASVAERATDADVSAMLDTIAADPLLRSEFDHELLERMTADGYLAPFRTP